MKEKQLGPRTLQVEKWLEEKRTSFQSINEEHGLLKIQKFNCKVGSPDKDFYRIKVNLDWFKGDRSNQDKPWFPRLEEIEVDFYLFLEGETLLTLHYLRLREYAYQLEKNRERWWRYVAEWGMRIENNHGVFRFCWNGGNTLRFPLQVIDGVGDFAPQNT